MSLCVSILNASGQFDEIESTLHSVAEKSLKKVSDIYGIDVLDLTVSPFYEGEEPSSGIGGYSLSAQRVEVLLDSNRIDALEVFGNEIDAVLAHEINHCLRQSLGFSERYLIDFLVSEGLACYSERIFNGGFLPSFLTEIKDVDWHEIYKKMKPLLISDSFNFDTLFLGEELGDYPKYAGYWVGYNLVKKYAENENLTDIDLINIKSEEFLI